MLLFFLSRFRGSTWQSTINKLARFCIAYKPNQVDQNLGSFSDRDLANLLWSFAALGHRNALILDHLMAAATDLSCFTPDSLHLVIWSLGRLSYSPSEEWVQDFLDTIEPTLFQLTPAQMVDVVWALARIGEQESLFG